MRHLDGVYPVLQITPRGLRQNRGAKKEGQVTKSTQSHFDLGSSGSQIMALPL